MDAAAATAAAIAQWLWAPVLSVGISCVYFVKAPALSIVRRLGVSVHGALLAWLYAVALGVDLLGFSRESFAVPFWVAFALPVASAVFALATFRGNRALHLFQLLLLACATWTFVVGTMAITGNWL